MTYKPSRPVVVMSYSWESPEHKAWVEGLAVRLRSNGVDVRLDDWTVGLGGDLNAYMESMADEDARVVAVVSDGYARKAKNRSKTASGVGIEAQILTASTYRDLGTDRVIPVIRDNTGSPAPNLPVFLEGRLYVDFRGEQEPAYLALLAELVGYSLKAAPPLGTNPFEGTTEAQAVVTIQTSPHRWSDLREKGRVDIPLSRNSGRFSLGSGDHAFHLFIQYLSSHLTRHMSDYIGHLGMVVDAFARPDVFRNLEQSVPMDNRISEARPGDVLVALNKEGYWALLAPEQAQMIEGFNGPEPILPMRYVIRADRTPNLTLADLPPAEEAP